ncbi:hypothetical protein GC722_14955 [Auraticoccus sp. F435]|uniref:Uncharacterized protein n=1 Tax=Auraticoccus cholistanensis TaxID=2656650 RepID=A0A6A9V1K1_9ACTN|nr:hypothetical protein [Auraticoccus cholistanensis]MVA77310.1 hypothetical protein [Auraticoccus cholistanensis]
MLSLIAVGELGEFLAVAGRTSSSSVVAVTVGHLAMEEVRVMAASGSGV